MSETALTIVFIRSNALRIYSVDQNKSLSSMTLYDVSTMENTSFVLVLFKLQDKEKTPYY